jgi:hypothetical protein
VTVTVENVRADLIWTYYVKVNDSMVKNVKLYLFKDLTDDILPNHEAIYQKYLDVLTSMDDSIPIGGV